MWDAHGKHRTAGPLATDRPHVAKVYGAYSFRSHADRANLYVGSGTPISTYVDTLNGIEVFVNGAGTWAARRCSSTTDLLLSHELK
jgi:hypothetical protein